MNITQARDMLVEAITSLQAASAATHVAVGPATRPLEDIEGFDSLNCVEVEAYIAKRATVEIKTIEFMDNSGQPLSIEEIAGGLANQTDD